MKDKRILYVSSEVLPYLPQNDVSQSSYEASKTINNLGGQTRIFMPRYGLINERRHQLHEVIRLSGMNLVINDLDIPLVIKVASIPKERIQVYFIDNDEYFKRKGLYSDKTGAFYEDNDERAIFFTKGIIETIKKLNWIPDVIHIHGWLSALLPLYIRNYYGKESIFSDTKIVTSVFNNEFEGTLSDNLHEKLLFDQFAEKDIEVYKDPTFTNLIKNAIQHSDGILLNNNKPNDEILKYIEELKKPVASYENYEELNELLPDFYNNKI